MLERTVREISGEIWAEIETRTHRNIDPFNQLVEHPKLLSDCIDLIAGVLARYDGYTIRNDEDLPVSPLPLIQ